MLVDLTIRTRNFALLIIDLYKQISQSGEGKILGNQILRSGTSVGAQYREAQRARSKAEFQAKLGSALQELDETGYWLELLDGAKIIHKEKFLNIYEEQQALRAIFISSLKKLSLK